LESDLNEFEQLFDNVFKLYDSGDKINDEYFQDEIQQQQEDGNNNKPVEPFPFADAEKFLMMAKYQIDNVVKVMELSIQQKELTVSRLDNQDLRRNRNPPNLIHLKAMKKNVNKFFVDEFLKILDFQQISDCQKILSRGSASCSRAVQLSRNYIKDVSSLRKCWRITGARSQSSWDRTIYVDCSPTQVPFSAVSAVSPNLIALRPDDKEESEGQVKISKTELISKFGGSSDALASDPTGAVEVGAALKVVQSAVLFKEIFQELVQTVSTAGNPFFKVFKDNIFIDTPGFDRFQISLKQFPKVGLEISLLDKCRLAAIEASIVEEYLNRKFDVGISCQPASSRLLLDSIISKVHHFHLRSVVIDKLSSFAIKHLLKLRVSDTSSSSSSHFHARLLLPARVHIPGLHMSRTSRNLVRFEVKVDGTSIFTTRADNAKPFGFGFPLRGLGQLDAVLVDLAASL
jgi:hypothetical protein